MIAEKSYPRIAAPKTLNLRQRCLNAVVDAERQLPAAGEDALARYRTQQAHTLAAHVRNCLARTIDPATVRFRDSFAFVTIDGVRVGVDGFTFMAAIHCPTCDGCWPGQELGKDRADIELGVWLASGADRTLCAACREKQAGA